MHEKLYKLMKNDYCAYPLMMCSEDVKPGMLLQTEWDWFGNLKKFVGEEGYPWDLLDMGGEQVYPSKFKNVSIIAGSVTDKVTFGANLALPQFGFSADASFNEAKAAVLTVSGVKAMSFEIGFSQYELRLALRKLKESDPLRWCWVDNDFLVTDSYYTSNLRFEFKKEGGFNAKAEYEKLGNNIAGGFQCEWKSDTTLELVGTAATPFAVRGIKI